jgi:adenylate kinase family enzyme
MKNTLLINLFAGPGAGKSTGATYIFSKLKLLDYDAEYVSEFAKDEIRNENKNAFNCQIYLCGNQVYRISRVFRKVDFIVTDSPLLLAAAYTKTKYLDKAIFEEEKKFEAYSLNFFINRTKSYNHNGRNETYEQACSKDKFIKNYLLENNIKFSEISGNAAGYDEALKIILSLKMNNALK